MKNKIPLFLFAALAALCPLTVALAETAEEAQEVADIAGKVADVAGGAAVIPGAGPYAVLVAAIAGFVGWLFGNRAKRKREEGGK